MALIVAVVVLLLLMLAVAPYFGHPTRETWAKGLSALQTVFTLSGIVVLVGWYVLERPDAARLKFDHAAQGFMVQDGQALVVLELKIENVGSRQARFANTPYTIVVQKVSPLDAQVLASDAKPDAGGHRRLVDANNWTMKDAAGRHPGVLAYRIGGKASGDWAPTNDGFSSTIKPSEEDFYYYRALVPCEEGLIVSISSRFRTLPGPVDRLWSKPKLVWIKQSFLDLSEVCKKEPT